MLEAARATEAEAKARAKQIGDAIKSEAVALAPENTRSIIIAGGPGIPDWHCHYVESWRLDTKRMKDDEPLTYVRFAVQSGTWKIDKAGG